MTDADLDEAIEEAENFLTELTENMSQEDAKEFYENIGVHANTMAGGL